MRNISLDAAPGGGAAAYPKTGRQARTPRRKHRPGRARYADAGRSGREAVDRLREAEQQAREEGRRVPASCSRVLLEIVAQVSLYSRTNDVLSVARLVTLTGLSRNTVRAALARLEEYGCITRVTPENIPGKCTGDTVIALPVVAPPEDAPEDEDDEQQHEPPPSPAARLTGPWSVQVDRTPGQSRLTPSEKYPRRKYEGEAPRSREAVAQGAPVGRSYDRPPPCLEKETPNTDGEVSDEAAAAANSRMRDALDSGQGVHPQDVQLVERWTKQQRDKAEREAQARRVAEDYAATLLDGGVKF